MMASQFRKARDERTEDVARITNPLSAMSRGGGGKIVNRIRQKQNPLGVLSQSQFNQRESLEGQIRRNVTNTTRDEMIPEGEPLSNVVHPVNRKIYALSKHFDAIDQYELAILFKKDGNNLKGARLRDSHVVQDNPLPIVNPVTFNFMQCEHQLKMQETRLAEYDALTPRDVWVDWSIDGVVEYANTYEDTGSGGTVSSAGKKKRATVISKGPKYIYNYWAHSELRPGGHCYAIIKKYGQAAPHYTLTNRFSGASYDQAVKTVSPVIEESGRAPFHPYQMGFFCLPYGGTVPLELLTYSDEYGLKHYDALPIFLGTVQFTPRQQTVFYPSFHDQLPVRNNDPFTDSNVGTNGADAHQLTMLKLILDCDDGVMPI